MSTASVYSTETVGRSPVEVPHRFFGASLASAPSCPGKEKLPRLAEARIGKQSEGKGLVIGPGYTKEITHTHIEHTVTQRNPSDWGIHQTLGRRGGAVHPLLVSGQPII